MEQHGLAEQMAGSCLVVRTRLVSRVVSGLYDDALRPLGLKASQLNLLVVIARGGPIRRSEIGRMLHLDSSTLTRNLRVMLAHDWIKEVPDGQDGRGLPLRATPAGLTLLADAGPAWQAAQQDAARLLGEDGAALVMRLSAGLLGSGGS